MRARSNASPPFSISSGSLVLIAFRTDAF